ncbi:MAG: esterase-like activity of phytase family protein [Phycisphaerales bacterium]
MLHLALLSAVLSVQPELREVDRLELPSDHSWLGTKVGGISGIDYLESWDTWAMISDDKGQHGPVRGYLAKIQMTGDRLTNVEVTTLLPMSWGTGELFTQEGFDPEGIRILPHKDFFGDPTMVWVSEGAGMRGVPTRVYEVCTGATRMDTWTAPESYAPKRRSGIRNNRAYESVAVIADRVAVVATEEPLRQDGSIYVRMSKLDLNRPESEPVAQLAYPLDEAPTTAPGGQNGLVDLVALEGGRFLSVERSWNMAAQQSIRVFLVETTNATDVLEIESLNSGGFTPVEKTLIADLGDRYGNAEGMCLGPVLETGERSLVLVSDNNFAPGMPTIFSLFAIVDPEGEIAPADRLGRRESVLGSN